MLFVEVVDVGLKIRKVLVGFLIVEDHSQLLNGGILLLVVVFVER